jgi:hypothetical protein
MKRILVIVSIMSCAIVSMADSTALKICNQLHPNGPANVIEKCGYDFANFKGEQELMAMGEKAKSVLKQNSQAAQKVLAVATIAAEKAEEEGRMYAYNTAKTVALNALNYGTGSGVKCSPAVDPESDEDAIIIPGLFECSITMNTRIIYLQSSCGEPQEVMWDQKDEELEVNFLMTKDGKIDASSIYTKAFEIRRSCAG